MDVLVDTNVILRRLQRAHPQHRQARDAITKLSVVGNRVCLTSQNLIELWAVCTRPAERNGLGLTPAQADRVVALVESSFSDCRMSIVPMPNGVGLLSRMSFPARRPMTPGWWPQ